MGSVHVDVDTDELLDKLTVEEKVSLLAAKDWWRTPIISRKGVFIPHVKVYMLRMTICGQTANHYRQPMVQMVHEERVM